MNKTIPPQIILARIVWLILALWLTSCNLPTQSGTSDAAVVQDYPVLVNPADLPTASLSPVQVETLQNQGYPDRFVIHFATQIRSDGQTGPLRQETWYYDPAGEEIVFQNGEIFFQKSGQPVSATGLGRTAYRPEMFIAGMTLDMVLAASGQDGFYAETINNGIIENGQLIFVQGLAAGFQEDRLQYIESLPLGAAGQNLAPEVAAPPEIAAPTPMLPTPTVSAPDETIIYESNQNGQYDLYALQLESGVTQNLTSHLANDQHARCSPNGSQIAFVSDRTGNQEIYIMTRNGENLTQITTNQTQFKGQIVWLSETELNYWDGSGDFAGWFNVNLSTQAVKRIDTQLGDDLEPDTDLSPDGTAELDAVKMDDDSYDVFIIDAQGKRNLTANSGYDDWWPIWAPDSERFVYVSNQDGDNELYVMDRNGNLLQKLTDNDWREYTGCWLP